MDFVKWQTTSCVAFKYLGRLRPSQLARRAMTFRAPDSRGGRGSSSIVQLTNGVRSPKAAQNKASSGFERSANLPPPSFRCFLPSGRCPCDSGEVTGQPQPQPRAEAPTPRSHNNPGPPDLLPGGSWRRPERMSEYETCITAESPAHSQLHSSARYPDDCRGGSWCWSELLARMSSTRVKK